MRRGQERRGEEKRGEERRGEERKGAEESKYMEFLSFLSRSLALGIVALASLQDLRKPGSEQRAHGKSVCMRYIVVIPLRQRQ